jgi:hypothetical protein
MMTTAWRCYMTKGICFRVWAVRSTFRVSLFRNTLWKSLLRPSLFWNFTRFRLVVSYRRQRTTYRPNLQGPTVEGLADRLLRNGDNYQSRLRNIPKERRYHLHWGWSLKSHTTSLLHASPNRMCCTSCIQERVRLAMNVYYTCWVIYRVEEVMS